MKGGVSDLEAVRLRCGYVRRENHFFADRRGRPSTAVPPVRRALRRRAQGAVLLLDQYLCLAFAQLTWRESLRDIEACLAARPINSTIWVSAVDCRNTLANANAVRDWRIYADFAQHLIGIARRLYAQDDPLALELDDTVYALDSTTIDLCLSVFPWAPFRSTKAAVKLHTLLDLRGNIPSFIFISDGKMHDVNILDQLVPEAAPSMSWIAAISISNVWRGSMMPEASSSPAPSPTSRRAAAIRARSIVRPVSSATRLFCLTGFYSRQGFNRPLRRIKFNDPQTGKRLVFLTNNFALDALTIAKLYKCRWQVELFFKWIKQHLRIKRSSAPPRTPSNPKSGSRFGFTSSSPS